MTMPHLMNCEHSDDGWCLNCVKNLYEENRRIPLHVCAKMFLMLKDQLRFEIDSDGPRLLKQLCGPNGITSLRDVARQSGFSPTYLSRCMSADTALSFAAYVSLYELCDTLEGKRRQDNDAFIKHLESASDIIAGWPEWKRLALSGGKRT